MASLLHSGKKGFEKGIDGGAAFQHQWPLFAPIVTITGQTTFHSFEIGQAVSIIPGVHARFAAPLFIIHRVAPLKDHAVDAAGAA